MNANELFELSKKKESKVIIENKILVPGLTNRIVNILFRAGFITIEEKTHKRIVDKTSLYLAVTSGRIWVIQNIGKISIMQICEYLVSLPNDFEAD